MIRYLLSCRHPECRHLWLWPASRIEIKQKCPQCNGQWWRATRV